jgi:hypothetical protein
MSTFKPKPAPWAVNPSQVSPEWRWFWEGIIFAMPMWEGQGASYNVVNWHKADVFQPTGWQVGESGPQTDHFNQMIQFNNRPSYETLEGSMSQFFMVTLDGVSGADIMISAEQASGESENENALIFTQVAFNGYTVIHEHGLGTNEQHEFTPNPVLDGITPEIIGITRDNQNTEYAFYRNNVNKETWGYTTNPSNGSGAVKLSIMERDGDLLGADGRLHCFYLSNAVWSEKQMRMLTNDPWGPFRRDLSTSLFFVAPAFGPAFVQSVIIS